MEKNDGALRAMLEELDAELERRAIRHTREPLVRRSRMHWMAERAGRDRLVTDQALALVQ